MSHPNFDLEHLEGIHDYVYDDDDFEYEYEDYLFGEDEE